MINDVVFYGDRHTLLEMPSVSVGDIKTEYWTGNCYGINLFAYCTEALSEEDVEVLQQKFEYVGGNFLHTRFVNQYEKIVRKWTESFDFMLEEFGVFLDLQPSNNLITMGIHEACRNTLVYDSANPHANHYFIDAGKANLDDIPNFYAIGDELLQNYKKRHSAGFKTTGGGLHEVNPINGSNIVYTNVSNSVIIGQSHPLQQFFKLDTLKQVFANIHLVRSTLIEYPDSLYEMIAKHLQIELKYLEDYEQTTQ